MTDANIRFNGLRFSQPQLNSFLAKADVNTSFAFSLIFPTKDGERAALASTKSKGFEVITLAGYVFKK